MKPIKEPEILKISSILNDLINNSSELKLFKMPKSALKEYFTKKKYEDKLQILKLIRNDPIEVAQIEDFIDQIIDPISTNKGDVLPFQIITFGNTFKIN